MTIVGQTGEKQRKKGSTLLALRKQPVADSLFDSENQALR